MFKLLFIKPHARWGFPQVIDIPLAFLYLSAYLKKHLKENIAIEVIDLRLKKRPGKALAAELQRVQPDLVGISLLAQDKSFPADWCKFIMDHCPNSRIIIGGPGATYDYDDVLRKNKEIVCAVVGEGERVLLNLVKAFIKEDGLSTVKGIAYLKEEQIVLNDTEDFIEDLDALPLPDYDLLNLNDYMSFFQLNSNVILAEKRHMPVMSSRGCPYGCLYCHDIFGKKTRKKSPAVFFSEIKILYEKYNIREFHIIDDIFNVDRQRMHAILDLIIKSDMDIKLSFPNGLRADLLTREDVQLLKKAGTYKMVVAIETVSPRLQKIINKNLNIERAFRSIDYAKEAGMLTQGYFMLGFPGETVEEIKATINYALNSDLDMASFLSVVPYKNTGLPDLVREVYPDFYDFKQVSYWEHGTYYQQATGYPLKRTLTIASLRFYLPFRIFKTFFNMPRKIYGITRWLYWGPKILWPQFFYRKPRNIMRRGLLSQVDLSKSKRRLLIGEKEK